MANLDFHVYGPDFTCQPFDFSTVEIASSFNKKIFAPVGAGSTARNVELDVLTVKDLLNRVPSANGGPFPLLNMTAVCDHLMIAAIKRFQMVRLGMDNADGVVSPHGETLQALNFNPAGVVDLVGDLRPRITRLTEIITAARGALQLARFQLTRPKPSGGLPSLSANPVLDKLNRHFHLDRSKDPLADFDFIDSIYVTMLTAIGYIPMGVEVFKTDVYNVPYLGYSYSGGYELARRFQVVQQGLERGANKGSIYLCSDLLSLDEEAVVYTMLHELAHFVGPTTRDKAIKDFGYAHKPGYDALPPDLALRTADCYAQFAFDAINRHFDPKQHKRPG